MTEILTKPNVISIRVDGCLKKLGDIELKGFEKQTIRCGQCRAYRSVDNHPSGGKIADSSSIMFFCREN